MGRRGAPRLEAIDAARTPEERMPLVKAFVEETVKALGVDNVHTVIIKYDPKMPNQTGDADDGTIIINIGSKAFSGPVVNKEELLHATLHEITHVRQREIKNGPANTPEEQELKQALKDIDDLYMMQKRFAGDSEQYKYQGNELHANYMAEIAKDTIKNWFPPKH